MLDLACQQSQMSIQPFAVQPTKQWLLVQIAHPERLEVFWHSQFFNKYQFFRLADCTLKEDSLQFIAVNVQHFVAYEMMHCIVLILLVFQKTDHTESYKGYICTQFRLYCD